MNLQTIIQPCHLLIRNINGLPVQLAVETNILVSFQQVLVGDIQLPADQLVVAHGHRVHRPHRIHRQLVLERFSFLLCDVIVGYIFEI